MKFYRPRLGVGTKTLMALTLVFWIPVAALAGLLYLMFGEMLQEEGVKHIRVQLQGAHNVIGERANLLRGIIDQMAKSAEVRSAMSTQDSQTLQTLLQEHGKTHNFITIFAAVDAHQRVISRRNDLRNDVISIGETLPTALRTGSTQSSVELVSLNFLMQEDEVLARLVENLGLVHFTVSPVLVNGEVLGALVAGIVISADSWFGNSIYNHYGGELAIFAGNPRDTLYLHATTSLPRSTWVLGQTLPPEIHGLIKLGRPYSNTLNIAGKSVVAAFEPLLDSSNRIIGAIGVSMLNGDTKAAIMRTIAIAIILTAVIALIIALLSVFFVHHDITRPLAVIQDAMKRFGEGELNTQLNLKTGDQLEELGERFNLMAHDICRREDRFKKHNEVAKLFMSTLDMAELIEKTLNIVVSVTQSQMGVIYLWDEHRQRLVPYANYGTGNDLRELAMGEGFPGQAASERQPIFLEVPTQDGNHVHIEVGFAQLSPVEIVYIPLTYMDRILGVLMLGSLHPYPDDEVQLFDHLADQISIALDNAQMHQRVQEMSITDGLTELYNRRFFNQRLEQEWARAHRYQQPISILLSDIDNFKMINDSHGHGQGDLVLKEIANIFRQYVRKEDFVARYGGEEFVVLLPQTETESAEQLAQRICEAVRMTKFDGMDGPVTLSIGVASFPELELTSYEALVAGADQAMYQAKSSGKNRVVALRGNVTHLQDSSATH